jgi:hypothetical protein
VCVWLNEKNEEERKIQKPINKIGLNLSLNSFFDFHIFSSIISFPEAKDTIRVHKHEYFGLLRMYKIVLILVWQRCEKRREILKEN